MIPIAFVVLSAAAAPAALPAGPVPPVRPRANLAALFADGDYPRAAIRRGEQGDVGFRLVVAPDGRVTRCDVTASSGSAALDRATCRIVAGRARFTPARDAAGNPVADVVASRVHWALPPATGLASYISARDYPREALRRREQGRVEFELAVSPEGRVAGCRILASSGSAALDAQTCVIMTERPRLTPARDAEGRPTTDTIRSAVRWVLPTRPLIPINPRPYEPRILGGR